MNPAPQWKIAAASVTGTSHVRLGTPCQDYAIARVLVDLDGRDVLLVVVSDGAGSAAKAEIGSSIACTTIAEALEVYLAEGGRVEAIDTDVAQRWLSMVQGAITAQAEDEAGVVRDYACTLLVAVVGENAAATMQVGDGAMVISEGDGWSWAHWPQRGEFANTTFFATEERAQRQMAFARSKGRIVELAAFSDGIEPLVIQYATQSVFEPFFDKMFPAVRAAKESGLNEELSTALANYLASPSICARTDDDKTLVLATRREEAVAAESSESTAQPKSAAE